MTNGIQSKLEIGAEYEKVTNIYNVQRGIV